MAGPSLRQAQGKQKAPQKKDGIRCDGIYAKGHKFAGETCNALLFEKDQERGLGARCGRCGTFHTFEELAKKVEDIQTDSVAHDHIQPQTKRKQGEEAMITPTGNDEEANGTHEERITYILRRVIGTSYIDRMDTLVVDLSGGGDMWICGRMSTDGRKLSVGTIVLCAYGKSDESQSKGLAAVKGFDKKGRPILDGYRILTSFHNAFPFPNSDDSIINRVSH